MDVPNGKKVILRLDLDVKSDSDLRLVSAKETIEYLLQQDSKIIIIGHKGRPEGKIDNSLSLNDTSKILSKIINKEIIFTYDIAGAEAKDEVDKLQNGQILMLENLRFDIREEQNDENFAKSLASLGEFYVNDAFGVSHRDHASIVGIPKFLPHTFGLRFEKEMENLSNLNKKPIVVIVSGIKKDKVEMAKSLAEKFDKVLVGGRLPEFFGDAGLESVRLQPEDAKLVIGNITQDKEDITLNTIQRFEKEIEKAGTIILAGVLGKYEDGGHIQGTKEVFTEISKSNAFKIAGGGDTELALSQFGLTDKFDWISVGGGAMLEYLTKGTLVGLKALE